MSYEMEVKTYSEFPRYLANRAYYKSGIISPEYHQKLLNTVTKPKAIIRLHRSRVAIYFMTRSFI